ncbi:MAG: hypothetical protein ACUVWV_04450 [Thermodesulfobacteriota bacterium]
MNKGKINKLIIGTLVFSFLAGALFALAARLPFICNPFNSEKLNKAGPCFYKTLKSSENLSLTEIDTFNHFAQEHIARTIGHFQPAILLFPIFSIFAPLRC